MNKTERKTLEVSVNPCFSWNPLHFGSWQSSGPLLQDARQLVLAAAGAEQWCQAQFPPTPTDPMAQAPLSPLCDLHSSACKINGDQQQRWLHGIFSHLCSSVAPQINQNSKPTKKIQLPYVTQTTKCLKPFS